jgi:hypothetical protein
MASSSYLTSHERNQSTGDVSQEEDGEATSNEQRILPINGRNRMQPEISNESIE